MIFRSRRITALVLLHPVTSSGHGRNRRPHPSARIQGFKDFPVKFAVSPELIIRENHRFAECQSAPATPSPGFTFRLRICLGEMPICLEQD